MTILKNWMRGLLSDGGRLTRTAVRVARRRASRPVRCSGKYHLLRAPSSEASHLQAQRARMVSAALGTLAGRLSSAHAGVFGIDGMSPQQKAAGRAGTKRAANLFAPVLTSASLRISPQHRGLDAALSGDSPGGSCLRASAIARDPAGGTSGEQRGPGSRRCRGSRPAPDAG